MMTWVFRAEGKGQRARRAAEKENNKPGMDEVRAQTRKESSEGKVTNSVGEKKKRVNLAQQIAEVVLTCLNKTSNEEEEETDDIESSNRNCLSLKKSNLKKR